eukprot:gene8941-10485_t
MYLRVIVRLAQTIPTVGYSSKSWLPSRYFQMVALVAQKNHLMFADQSAEDLTSLVSFFLPFLGQASTNATQRMECLKALSLLVYNNGPFIPQKSLALLVETLTAAMTMPASSPESRRLATVALGNVSLQCGAKLSRHYAPMFIQLFANLEQLAAAPSGDKFTIKFTCSTLRTLHLILAQCKGVADPKALALFSLLKRLIFQGTSINPAATLPSQMHVVDTFNKYASSSLVKKKKSAPFQLDSSPSSSDSDVDERGALAKVRLSALALLTTLAKTSPRLFFGQWSMFLPTTSFTMTPSIFTSMLHDADYRVKAASLNLLATILDGSRTLLVALPAPTSGPARTTTSFTTFSQSLSTIITEIHKGLLCVLDQEKQTPLLTQVVRCLATLVANAPYDRLPAGLLTGIISAITPYIVIADPPTTTNNCADWPATQLASLNCLFNILSSTPQPLDDLTPKLSALAQSIISLATNPAADPATRIEAIQCLGAFSSHHFSVFVAESTLIYTLLFDILTSPTAETTLRIQSSKTLEEITKSIQETQKLHPITPGVESALWDHFFKALTGLIEDPQPQIRAAICNCLSHLTSKVFSDLPVCIIDMIKMLPRV